MTLDVGPDELEGVGPTPRPRPARSEGAAKGFGKFRLLERIGQGGMGEVYLALASGPTGFNKLVVVKLLREEFALNGSIRAMFLDEGRLLSRLNHPNVVQTNEVGVAGADHYLVMEYLEGQSLDQTIKRAGGLGVRVPRELWLRVALDALAGLDYAHELCDYDGTPLFVVHRDLSPHNIFLTYDGIVKLLDFGIAKAGTQSHRTQTGTVKGKPGYMPPEQLLGTPVDRRADLYVFGIVLWEMFTGVRLFVGTPSEGIVRIVGGPLPRVSSVVPGFDPGLDAVVARALERDPDARFQTARDMREALARAAGEVPPQESVGELMRALFREQREQRRLAVQRHVSERLRDADGAPRESGGAAAPARARGERAGPSTPPPRAALSSKPPAHSSRPPPALPPQRSARPSQRPSSPSQHPALPSPQAAPGCGAGGLLPSSGGGGTIVFDTPGDTPAPVASAYAPPTFASARAHAFGPGPGAAPGAPPGAMAFAPPVAGSLAGGAMAGRGPAARSPRRLRSALLPFVGVGLAAAGGVVWLLSAGKAGGESVNATRSNAVASATSLPKAPVTPTPIKSAAPTASAPPLPAAPAANVAPSIEVRRPGKAIGKVAPEPPTESASARATASARVLPAPPNTLAPPAAPRHSGRTFRTDL